MSERESLLNAVADRHRDLREGQALFNEAYWRWPVVVDRLRGTSADPFYLDDRIPVFLDALERSGVLGGAA